MDKAIDQFWLLVVQAETWLGGLRQTDYLAFISLFVAALAVFYGPRVQDRIGLRAVKTQAQIANQQLQIQAQIAHRQIADSISSKRQLWIDGLRVEMAEFLTVVGRIDDLSRPTVGALIFEKRLKKAFDQRVALEVRAQELGLLIKLRLNPNELAHQHLNDLIRILSVHSPAEKDVMTDEEEKAAIWAFISARDNIVTQLQIILKTEWERVKRGDL